MTDITNYLAYFRNLQSLHVNINSFFVMDINEPLAALRGEMKYPALIMNNVQGNFFSPNLDAILDQVNGGFLIIGRCDNMDDFGAEMVLLQQLKQIGIDVVTRMNHDLLKCEPRAVKAIPGFNLNTVNYQMVDGIFDNCLGFLFSYKLFAHVNLVFHGK